jgi:dihydrofolate reductase
MAENRVIGRDNQLPWHLPADLKRFQALTTGHTIIMGRKTFDSIGRPLPRRRTIVLTRDRKWARDGVDVTHDLAEALARVQNDHEVFIAGGAELYRHAFPIADRIYLTVVHAEVMGDAHFPAVAPAEWVLAEETTHAADDRHAFSYSFRRYERAKKF